MLGSSEMQEVLMSDINLTSAKQRLSTISAPAAGSYAEAQVRADHDSLGMLIVTRPRLNSSATPEDAVLRAPRIPTIERSIEEKPNSPAEQGVSRTLPQMVAPTATPARAATRELPSGATRPIC